MTDDEVLKIMKEAGIVPEPRFGQIWTSNIQMLDFTRRLRAAWLEELKLNEWRQLSEMFIYETWDGKSDTIFRNAAPIASTRSFWRYALPDAAPMTTCEPEISHDLL